MLQTTLVVGAWWPEIRALVGVFAGEGASENLKAPFPLSSAERSWIRSQREKFPEILKECKIHFKLDDCYLKIEGLNLAFAVTGIGGYRASAATATVLALSPEITQLLFCGTAGSYTSEFKINSALASCAVTFTDAGLVEFRSYLPGEKVFEKVTAEHSPISRLPKVRTVCPPSITTDPALAARFSDFGDVENLELFGVALTAQRFYKTWEAVLGVSNFVGPNAHEEWKTHHQTASLAAQAEVLRVLNGSFL